MEVAIIMAVAIVMVAVVVAITSEYFFGMGECFELGHIILVYYLCSGIGDCDCTDLCCRVWVLEKTFTEKMKLRTI